MFTLSRQPPLLQREVPLCRLVRIIYQHHRRIRAQAARLFHHRLLVLPHKLRPEVPHQRRHAKAQRPRTEAADEPSKATANAVPCRQDAVGGLLRALDLSPRCG